jgi:choline-sulfatase
MSAKPKAPNILFLMSDQMGAPVLPIHGHQVCRTPHLQELADSSIVFDSAYSNYPLCAPGRFSLLAGRLAASIGAYDNASEFTADTPTMAHYLSLLGYRTILCGKMHFIGPDQVHGFEERLTTDVYPSSFSFLPDWEKGPKWISSGTDLSSVVEAGPCVRSLQIDFDDEVEFFATQKIYDLVRDLDDRPFFLCVSFTQPHSPYTPGQEHWDRYRHDDIDLPRVPEIAFEDLDALSQGLYYAHGRDQHTVTDDDIRNARHGYYGMISAIDDKIGRLLAQLDETGMSDNTIVVYTTDHGDMMGERGMWYKHCFFEWSARVPMIIRHPDGMKPRHEQRSASHVDLLPTLLDFASDGNHEFDLSDKDGNSLVPLLLGDDPEWPDTVISDYLAIGPCTPCRMIRKGRFKFHYIHGHAPMLYDVEADPDEIIDLAGDPAFADICRSLEAELKIGWDPDELDVKIRESQRRRRLVAQANGGREAWDYIARDGDDKRYVRANRVDSTKRVSRFPPVDEILPDRPR